MDGKKLIIYIIIIIIILVAVFLSQQAYFKALTKPIVSGAANQAQAYMAKGANWVVSAIYPKMSGPVQSGGDTIKSGAGGIINQVTQKISDAEKNISNYFLGIKDAVEGKNNSACETP